MSSEFEQILRVGVDAGFVSTSYLVRRKDRRVMASVGPRDLTSDDFHTVQKWFSRARQSAKSGSAHKDAASAFPPPDTQPTVSIAKTVYSIVRLDGTAMYGRAEDASGFMAARTGQHVLINFYEGPDVAAGCAESLDSVAEYLKDKGR
eukprot:m.187390 g.187390  ORF g.187390 m.187390 type:complete len:148 (+) comp17054_c0_seq1:141-584(+)